LTCRAAAEARCIAIGADIDKDFRGRWRDTPHELIWHFTTPQRLIPPLSDEERMQRRDAVRQLEAGAGEWRMEWHRKQSMLRSIRGAAYRGINLISALDLFF
jgi:hypothetical protein